MKKALFVILGITSLTLGIVGIVLPVLPTTPLLLSALYCFARGSEKLNLWFRGTPLYKKYLADYVQTKSLSLRQKTSIQIFAGGMMVASFIFIENWILKIILGILFIIHNWVFIFKIKTCKTKRYDMKKNGVQKKWDLMD